MMDINPGPDTATFGNVYADHISTYDTSGNFRSAFAVQEGNMRVRNNDIFLADFFYGYADFDPGPGTFTCRAIRLIPAGTCCDCTCAMILLLFREDSPFHRFVQATRLQFPLTRVVRNTSGNFHPDLPRPVRQPETRYCC